MSDEVRRAVVAELQRLANSPNFRDRADAGRALASFADMPGVQQPLQQLLLDAADTFVTRATAEALLRQEDAAGLAAVASALTSADDNHADWIHTAVRDVFTIYAYKRDAAVRTCDAMIEGPDLPLRLGLAQLRDMLIEIIPVLRPVGED
ncbi:hypothetical protein E1258_16385 [Micromonospora sp. KC207]|uniref:hypothetical protein n=1 Tax=Micromonospora sp. KC207 TaxID=2530377 RepID=UPI001048859C|nr:hypothetical protein [Micromonospora sp. KC207]TDC59914.1 hypothetical protein E1258_16385 [Micromonospora sp. KC207]